MYESSFQLSKRPFGAAPQVSDYYPATDSESARKTLMRCVERNSGPSLLIGGPGIGKSILCLKIQEHFQSSMPTAYVSSCGIRTRRELLQQILFAFDRPYTASDEGELRISLANFVYAHSDGNVSLLLDDADDLPSELMEEVRSLSNLTQDGGWSINLILAGKSKLEELVGRPGLESLEQRIASRNYLHTWNCQETTDYVRFQLSRAGGDADSIFSDAAFEQLYALSDGLPRLVNQICDHSMIMAALGGIQQLDAIHLEEAWADLQQLPPPSRKNASNETQATGDHAAANDADDSMIEFGSLDDGDSQDTNGDSHSVCGPFDQLGADPENDNDFGAHLSENSEPHAADDESASDFGEDSCIQFDFDACDSSEADSDDCERDNETVVDAEPQLEAICEQPALDETGRDAEDCADEAEHCPDLRLAPSSQGDLVDRLDDIEREVQRVSNELLGDDDGNCRFGEPEPTQTNNPFLEIFDEEEIVFGTHNTLNNELVRRQPAVFTSGGDALIHVVRMVDQGPAPNEWELHDDITGSKPAGKQLALELSSLPGLAVRHAPEIVETNVCGNQFASEEFTYDYTVNTDAELPVIESTIDVEAGSELIDFEFEHESEDVHALERPGEIDAERESRLLSSLDCPPEGGVYFDDVESPIASEKFNSAFAPEAPSDLDSDHFRGHEADGTQPRDAVVSGSNVGSDVPVGADIDSVSVSYESSNELVFSSPSDNEVESADAPIFDANCEENAPQAESPSSLGVEVQPFDHPEGVLASRFRQPKDEMEPIEQAMILPENYRGQFSNNTNFGAPVPQSPDTSESFGGEAKPKTVADNSPVAKESNNNPSSRSAAPRGSKRPFKNLFSKLKANDSK